MIDPPGPVPPAQAEQSVEAAVDPASAPPQRWSGTNFPVPWSGPGHRADKLILALIVFNGLYYLATTPLVPILIADHPVLLAVIRGSATAVVALGAMVRTGEESLLVAVLAGLPGTILFDWVFWWAGRRWGENALSMLLGRSRNPQKQLIRLRRLTAKYGAIAVLLGYVGPVPVLLIGAAVGFGGMRLRTYLILDTTAALLWLGLLVGLGYAIGQSAVDAVEAVSRYGLWISLGLVMVVVARQVWVSRRATGAGGGPGRAPR